MPAPPPPPPSLPPDKAPFLDLETKLSLALQATDLGIWEWDLTADRFDYDQRAREIYGFSPGEAVTRDKLRALTHPDDRGVSVGPLQRALDPQARSKETYEYRILPPDGRVRWVRARGQAVFAAAGGVERAVRYVGTLQDVTERKQAEESLRASESRLRFAMESAHLGVWEYDATGPRFRGSPELNRLYGFRPDEAVELARFAERYEPGEAERLGRAGADSLKRGERFFEIEYRIRLPGGELRWLQLRAETEASPEGKALHSLGIVADITERKQAEEQRELLLGELNHRVKNMLSVVLGIASQTMRHSAGVDDFFKVFSDRVGALSRGYGLLTAQSWRPTSLVGLVSEIVQPHVPHHEQLHVVGDDVALEPKAALSLSLVLNELATNASKHGALTKPAGRIQIAVGVDGDRPQPAMVTLSWKETGLDGIATPRRRGFGSQLIEASVKHELKGSVEVSYRPGGVHYEFRFPQSQ